MAMPLSPTKGNLLQSKKTLALAKVGFDLLDRKRRILMREMMAMIARIPAFEERIDQCYTEAYAALQKAQIAHGLCDRFAAAVPVENGLSLSARSIMGVELPAVTLAARPLEPVYSLSETSLLVDEAYVRFNEVKALTAELAEVESGIYRLANAIRQTQKRANALKNIVIPRLTDTVATMTDALEEKEREDFSRLKVIKSQNKHTTG